LDCVEEPNESRNNENASMKWNLHELMMSCFDGQGCADLDCRKVKMDKGKDNKEKGELESLN
jgi:hypothetical protein